MDNYIDKVEADLDKLEIPLDAMIGAYNTGFGISICHWIGDHEALITDVIRNRFIHIQTPNPGDPNWDRDWDMAKALINFFVHEHNYKVSLNKSK